MALAQDGSYDLSRAARVIARADIAAVQEVDRHWSRSRHDDQPALLAALLPDHYHRLCPRLRHGRRHPTDRNRRRQFGPMILSRWPILWTRTHLLPLRRMLDPDQHPDLRARGLHRHPHRPPARAIASTSPMSAWANVWPRSTTCWPKPRPPRGAALTTNPPATGPKASPNRPAPPAPSGSVISTWNRAAPNIIRLTGQTPYHPGARYAEGLVDAVALTGTTLHTHEKTIAGTLRLRQLDHCFVTPDLAPRVTRAWADTTETASDHFPLWVELA